MAHHSKDCHDKSSKDSLSKCADLLESLDRRSRIGTMLIEFYRVHNISKIDTIGSLLDQFEGVADLHSVRCENDMPCRPTGRFERVSSQEVQS